MAKKTQAKEKKTGTAVAKTGASSGNVPAHLANYKSTGVGVPNEVSDFLIPMARVLDAKSPEVQKRDPNYIDGAEAGDIYIKNSPQPIIKGDDGFVFQCCHRDHAVIEWMPRTSGGGGGGGFVARHAADFIEKGGDAEQRPHPEDAKKKIWYRKSTGNLLVETRYYDGYIIDLEGSNPPMPLSIPFASTGHTVAKGWNMLMAQKRLNGAMVDIWLVYYRITTMLKSRGNQSWFLFSVADAGEEGETMWVPSDADAKRGQSLNQSLSKGEKQRDTSGQPSGSEEGDDKM